MGTVYRGVDTASDAHVAIKRLRPEVVAENPVAIDRFKHEAHTLRRLNHPSVVRFVAMIEENAQHYLITEYVAGGSLKQLLAEETPLSVQRAVEVGFDLSDALASAHELGIIHRDIKPTNILFDEDGTPRLADFGVALELSSAQPSQGPGDRTGTLTYMSPEADRGEAAGPESDIWSLGLVMFEMLTGRLPFEDAQRGYALAAQTKHPIPSIAAFRPEVPDGLASLIGALLEVDRTRRISSARQVSSALEAVLNSLERMYAEEQTAPRVMGSDLPSCSTLFIGRNEELEKLRKLLRDPCCRLVTLVGPGGIGKSRLAAEASTRNHGFFSDGACFVPLAAVASQRHIVPAIASALGFSFSTPSDPQIQLINYLGEKELLLVLDNFEHLIEGKELLEEIVKGAPHITILVTTREHLNIEGETLIEIQGLPVQEEGLEEPEAPDAMKLFLNRALQASAGFSASVQETQAISRICELLDGSPLGIELAAAWVESRSCEEIADDITNNLDFLTLSHGEAPERHRGLRAVFDHSWHLLLESEKRAFRRMAVFHGGFTLRAARRVVGVPLAVLSALVGKSLLRKTASGRYQVHELLRQYADESLRETSGELEETRELHGCYFAEFMHTREPLLGGRGEKVALQEIEEEIENIRAGWSWLVEHHRVDEVDRFIDCLFIFHLTRGWFQAGEELFSEAVSQLGETRRHGGDPRKSDLVSAKILGRQAAMCQTLGLLEKARELHETSFQTLEELGAGLEMAYALNDSGLFAIQRGEFEKAREQLERGLELARKVGDSKQTASALTNLGRVAQSQGNYAEADKFYSESLDLYTELGHERGKATCLNNLGSIAYLQEDYVVAKRLYEESLRISRDIGDQMRIAGSMCNLGNVAHNLEDYARAKRLRQESLTIFKSLGEKWRTANCLDSLARSLSALGEFDSSKQHYRDALRISVDIGAVPMALASIEGIAVLQGKLSDTEDALRLLAFVIHHPATYQGIKDEADKAQSELTAHLSPGAAEAAEETGKSAEFDDVVKKVLGSS
jgi:predicted ATPase/Tfp pilus assembly protein PilF